MTPEDFNPLEKVNASTWQIFSSSSKKQKTSNKIAWQLYNLLSSTDDIVALVEMRHIHTYILGHKLNIAKGITDLDFRRSPSPPKVSWSEIVDIGILTFQDRLEDFWFCHFVHKPPIMEQNLQSSSWARGGAAPRRNPRKPHHWRQHQVFNWPFQHQHQIYFIRGVQLFSRWICISI